MSTPHLPWLLGLAQAFALGEVMAVRRLTAGLIQETWYLETTTGQYVSQKLHPIFNEHVTADGQVVSQFLRSRGFQTPYYHLTNSGDLHWHFESGAWRVMTYLAGLTYSAPPTLAYLESVGYVVGLMHQALAQLNYNFQFQIHDFHNTPAILSILQEHIQAKTRHASHSTISREADFFQDTVPDLFLPPDLPQQIIHADLKLSNFLFDEQGAVVAILDLDTFMYHSIYVEMGDAFRSWAARGSIFDLSAYAAGLRGYARSGALGELDVHYGIQGLKLITLELGIRFLNDVFEDYYFQWNPAHYPSRAAHNLTRCQRQIALYQDMRRKEAQMVAIWNQVMVDPSGHSLPWS